MACPLPQVAIIIAIINIKPKVARTKVLAMVMISQVSGKRLTFNVCQKSLVYCKTAHFTTMKINKGQVKQFPVLRQC